MKCRTSFWWLDPVSPCFSWLHLWSPSSLWHWLLEAFHTERVFHPQTSFCKFSHAQCWRTLCKPPQRLGQQPGPHSWFDVTLPSSFSLRDEKIPSTLTPFRWNLMKSLFWKVINSHDMLRRKLRRAIHPCHEHFLYRIYWQILWPCRWTSQPPQPPCAFLDRWRGHLQSRDLLGQTMQFPNESERPFVRQTVLPDPTITTGKWVENEEKIHYLSSF